MGKAVFLVAIIIGAPVLLLITRKGQTELIHCGTGVPLIAGVKPTEGCFLNPELLNLSQGKSPKLYIFNMSQLILVLACLENTALAQAPIYKLPE
jgi:hypothetical protein